jgi:outer membrane protein assembly factor BamB
MPTALFRLSWAAGCFSLAACGGMAVEWPQYRGANHDGVSTDRITTQWNGSVTNPVWLVPVPSGPCSLSVGGARVFTQIRRIIDSTDKDVCIALSATNGAELWATPVDAADYPHGGVGYDDGPRSTPTYDNGSVYVLSSYLKLYRLNATNGSVIWQKDLPVIYGGYVIAWQNAASPLLEDGLIYVNANCGTSTLLALHASDGSLAWSSQDNAAMTHSTPVLATIHGVRQVLFATQTGLISLNPQNGNLLWKASYPFFYSTSLAASAVVNDDMAFVTGAHAYGMGSFVVQVDFTNNTWTTTRLWSTNNPASHWMTPIAHQGFLYGQFGIQQFDSSPSTQLKCIDMRTGAVKWSTNNFGHDGTLLVNGHLLVLTEKGDLVLAEPNTSAYTEIARFLAIPNYFGDTNKCWNVPAVADGRVYARSTSLAACFDLSVPDLKLDSPQFLSADKFQLTLRTVNGSPLDTNRVPNLEVLTSTDATLPRSLWTRLTNSLVFTNGAVQIIGLDTSASPRSFFIVNELD